MVYFPIDMLRYDSCWPMRQEDVANITHSLDVRTRSDQGTTMTLVSYSDTKHSAKPTEARWLSFGWRVGEVKLEKLP
jgi:hypothetical protein